MLSQSEIANFSVKYYRALYNICWSLDVCPEVHDWPKRDQNDDISFITRGHRCDGG